MIDSGGSGQAARMDEREDAVPAVHLTPDDYHTIRPEDFGAPGLYARESVGPFVEIEALGELVTIHDSRFDPGKGIGHHPHRGMERLFYIVEGGVDHDDALNSITGHMGTGDLGILTEGRRGMIHSEWNHHDDIATRAYILVYPTEPTPPTAAFDAIRDDECERIEPAEGVRTKLVVDGGSDRLHGDLRRFTDTEIEHGASFDVELAPEEAGVVFVLDGGVTMTTTEGEQVADGVGTDHTVLLPPADSVRGLRIEADQASRVIHAVTGPGFGFRRRR